MQIGFAHADKCAESLSPLKVECSPRGTRGCVKRRSFLLAAVAARRQFMHMIRISSSVSAAAFGAVVLSLTVSCAMFHRNDSAALSQSEREALIRRGKSPQVFGVTAYSSDDGAVFAGAFRLHDGQMARCAFVSDANSTAPVIDAADGEVSFLVDTSAAESWLTTESMNELKGYLLKGPSPFEKFPRHVYDRVGGMAVIIPTLIIDKVHVENAIFHMRNAHGPLDVLLRWEKSAKIDGVLGADFLRAFKFVRISLRDRYLVLSATVPYPSAPNVTAVPLKELQGGLGVEAMVDGERMDALIDIAGDFDVALAQPGDAPIRHVSIGDAVFRQVEAISGAELGLGLDPTPRIGRQLLEKFDIVINEYGKQLILERPAK
jgi:hypothetical protein